MSSLKQRLAAYEGASSSSASSSSNIHVRQEQQSDARRAPVRDRRALSVRERLSVYQQGSDHSQMGTKSECDSSESNSNSNSNTAPRMKRGSVQERMAKYAEVTAPPGSTEMNSNMNTSPTRPPPKTKAIPKPKHTGAGLRDRVTMYKEVVAPDSQLDDFATVKMNKPVTPKKTSFKAKTPGGSDLRDRMAKYLSSPELTHKYEAPLNNKKQHHFEETATTTSSKERGGDMKKRMAMYKQEVRSTPTLAVPDVEESNEQPIEDDKPVGINSEEICPAEEVADSNERELTTEKDSLVASNKSPGEEASGSWPEIISGGSASMSGDSSDSLQTNKKRIGGMNDEILKRISAYADISSSPESTYSKNKIPMDEGQPNYSPGTEAVVSNAPHRPKKMGMSEHPQFMKARGDSESQTKKLGGSDLQQRMPVFEKALTPSEAFHKNQVSMKSKEEAFNNASASSSTPKKPVGGSEIQRRKLAFAGSSSPTPKAFQGGSSDLQKRMSAFAKVSSPEAFQRKTIPIVDEEHGSMKRNASNQQPTVIARSSAPKKAGMSEPQPTMAGGSDSQSMKARGNDSQTKKPRGRDLQNRLAVFAKASSPEAIQKRKIPIDKVHSSSERKVASKQHMVMARSLSPKRPGGSDLQRRTAAFAQASSPEAFQKKKIPIDEEHSSSKSKEVVSNAGKEQTRVVSRSRSPKRTGGGDLQWRKSAFQKKAIPIGEEYSLSKSKEKSSTASNEMPTVVSRSRSPKRIGGGDLQWRKSAFAKASSPEAFQKKAIPIGEEHGSSKCKEEGSSTSDEHHTVVARSLSPKRPRGSNLQRRMAAFAEASSPEAFQKKKIPIDEEHSSSMKQSGGVRSKERVDKFKGTSSQEASYKKKLVPEEHDEASHIGAPQSKESDLQQHTLASKEASAPEAFQKKKVEDHEASHDILRYLQEEVVKFKRTSSHQTIEKICLEEHNTLGRTASPSDGDSKEISVTSKEASTPQTARKKWPEEHDTSQHISSQPGGGLQERMDKFKEVSSPETFQKKKITANDMTHHTANKSESDLMQRMSAFQEVSAPEAFQKKKLEEHGTFNRQSIQAIRGLQGKMAKFKEVSSPEAFSQKKRLEGQGTSKRQSIQAISGLQGKMAKFKEVSSPEAFFDNKKKLEVERCISGPIAKETELSMHPPPFNPQDGECSTELEKPAAYRGRVVENRVNEVLEGTKDYEYLYDLAVNLEQLKLQEHDSPHFSAILEEEGTGEDKYGGGGDIKTSLERIMGGSTRYTASGNWLTEEWIKQHLITDENFGSLKFQFRDHMLFKRFDKTVETSRDLIIHEFVKQLLLHANDITQLDLSICLLPDKFLEVLAEEILKNPAGSFPNLQVLNFESNMLRGPGIEALSNVIGNKTAWKYLQAILLENQKHSMTSEAERALADAVSCSPSVVVCSVSVRCPYKQKEINDAILRNMDNLRLARRDHQSKVGTLKERKRNEMELFFDRIAANESDVTEVELVGDQKFLILEGKEKAKSGASFATNSSVKSIKMELLGLDDSFAIAFGNAIAKNNTIEKVKIDMNAITGIGIKAIFAGLGENNSISEFQVRHQKKVFATLDEEALPDLIMFNTTLVKLGVDIRNKIVKMRLDKIINANADHVRKLRANARH